MSDWLAGLRPPGGWYTTTYAEPAGDSPDADVLDADAAVPGWRSRSAVDRIPLARLPIRSPGRGRLPSSKWLEKAACAGVDPELFFPGRGESTREARAICAGCEVRATCLEHALDAGEKFGIWGGKSERERRRIRRQRAMGGAA